MFIQGVEFMDHECGTKKEFVTEILEGLNKKYAEKFQFESRTIDGLNGTKVDTVVALNSGKSEIFQLPIEAAYKCYMFMGIEEVFERMCYHIGLFEAYYAREDRIEAEKQIIQPWIINKDMNQDLLHRCPYTEYGSNYAIVYRKCPPFNDFQLNYGLITWESVESLSLDLAQLHELAMRNVQDFSLYTIQAFNGYWFETIDDFSNRKGTEYEEYIVRGVQENYSNGSLFCKEIWSKIGNMLGENYFLIPSSVHEWLIMSVSMVSKEKLEKANAEMNAEINLEDLLGDQYYLYDVEKDEMIPMKRESSLKNE